MCILSVQITEIYLRIILENKSSHPPCKLSSNRIPWQVKYKPDSTDMHEGQVLYKYSTCKQSIRIHCDLDPALEVLVLNCVCWDHALARVSYLFSWGMKYEWRRHETEYVACLERSAKFQLDFQILPVSTLVLVTSFLLLHHGCASRAFLVFWELEKINEKASITHLTSFTTYHTHGGQLFPHISARYALWTFQATCNKENKE